MCPKRTNGRCIFHLNQWKCMPDVRISNQAPSATLTRLSPLISLNSFYFSSQRRAVHTAPFTEFTRFVHYLQSIKVNFGLFSSDPENVRRRRLGAIWNFSKATGLPWLGHQIIGLTYIDTDRARTDLLFYSIKRNAGDGARVIQSVCPSASKPAVGYSSNS